MDSELIKAAFKRHEGAPSWGDDPVARDAAIRWHMRGYADGFEAAHAKELDTSPERVKNGPDSLHDAAQKPTHDVQRLSDALEATHIKLNEALAVIERAKAALQDRDVLGVGFFERILRAENILDTAPADALRQVKAEAWPEPQTEPTDAQVKTALELWSANEWRYGAASAMRAALRAALNTREEDRG